MRTLSRTKLQPICSPFSLNVAAELAKASPSRSTGCIGQNQLIFTHIFRIPLFHAEIPSNCSPGPPPSSANVIAVKLNAFRIEITVNPANDSIGLSGYCCGNAERHCQRLELQWDGQRLFGPSWPSRMANGHRLLVSSWTVKNETIPSSFQQPMAMGKWDNGGSALSQ